MNGVESHVSVNLPRWSHSCVYIGWSKFKRFGNMLTHTCYLTLTKYSKVKKKKNINEVFLIISGIISISNVEYHQNKLNIAIITSYNVIESWIEYILNGVLMAQAITWFQYFSVLDEQKVLSNFAAKTFLLLSYIVWTNWPQAHYCP